ARAKRNARTDVLEFFGERELVVRGRAFVEHTGHERRDRGIAGRAQRITRGECPADRDEVLRVRAIRDDVKAGDIGARDVRGDLPRKRNWHRAEQKSEGPKKKWGAHRIGIFDFLHWVRAAVFFALAISMGTNHPVVLWSGSRYFCATRCTSAGVT